MNNKVSEKKLEKIILKLKKDNIEKIVVGAVIVFPQNRLLLVRRVSDDFMGGLVELPSGTNDNGENIIETLIREVEEETSLEISTIDDFIDSFDYESGSGKKTRQLNFKVYVKNSTDDILLNPKEHDEFYLVNVQQDEELYSKLNISRNVRNIISLI